MSNDNLDDGLTDEEREALASSDDVSEDSGEGVQVTQSTADDNAVDEEEKKAAADDSDSAGDDSADKADPVVDDGTTKTDGDANQEDPTKVDAVVEQTAKESSPILVAELPGDAQDKLTEIAAKKNELIDQFDNGDITAKEYALQSDALGKEERAIERIQDRAELAAQMEEQRLQRLWLDDCAEFINANAAYKNNETARRFLDTEVMKIASDQQIALHPERKNWDGKKFLAEAHKNISEAFGLNDKKAETAQKQVREPRELPPTLAKVPSAQIEDTSGGQFAVLDRLANNDPIAYEEALAKMPDSQRNAYMAAG